MLRGRITVRTGRERHTLGPGDRIAIAAYLGKSDEADTAFTRFAEAYADQNDCDYQALREARPVA